jgi:hypothetical protein
VALMTRLATALLLAATVAGAAGAQADTGRTTRGDTLPAGFGSLRRDDVQVSAQIQGLTIRAIPLDESIIRTLAPDSYASLRAQRLGKAAAIDRVRTRLGLPSVQVWYVTYFNVQPGEARFDPKGMQLRSAGRDFRPLEVIGITPGFGDGRLAQGRSTDAIFVFDAAISLSHSLLVTLNGEQSAAWDAVLPLLERERASIWSRASAGRKPAADSLKGKSPPWQ